MELSNILGALTGNDAIGAISQNLKIDQNQVSSVISNALPSLLGAMQKNASTPGGAEALAKALGDHASNAGNIINNCRWLKDFGPYFWWRLVIRSEWHLQADGSGLQRSRQHPILYRSQPARSPWQAERQLRRSGVGWSARCSSWRLTKPKHRWPWQHSRQLGQDLWEVMNPIRTDVFPQ